jgi:hypothetical protein
MSQIEDNPVILFTGGGGASFVVLTVDEELQPHSR